jgi:hypothetical protein
MSSLALEKTPASSRVEAARREATARYWRRAGERGPRTLDDLIAELWEGLATREAVRCPACGGAMVARPPGPGEARGGRCEACGAELR